MSPCRTGYKFALAHTLFDDGGGFKCISLSRIVLSKNFEKNDSVRTIHKRGSARRLPVNDCYETDYRARYKTVASSRPPVPCVPSARDNFSIAPGAFRVQATQTTSVRVPYVDVGTDPRKGDATTTVSLLLSINTITVTAILLPSSSSSIFIIFGVFSRSPETRVLRCY